MELRKMCKLFILACLISSCAQIEVFTPSSRFLSPEATGKTHASRIQIHQIAGTTSTFNFDNDKLDNPLTLKNNKAALGLDFEMGIKSRIDIFTRVNSSSTPLLGAKFQILGDSRKDAKLGNNSLAISIAGGSLKSSMEEDNAMIGGRTLQDDLDLVSIQQRVFDISLIFGRRVTQDVLIYSSLQATKNDIEVHLSSKENPNLDDKNFKLSTTTYGVALGAIRYWRVFFINSEISVQSLEWDNNDKSEFLYGAISMGWKWN
jgi:hypothetical protein